MSSMKQFICKDGVFQTFEHEDFIHENLICVVSVPETTYSQTESISSEDQTSSTTTETITFTALRSYEGTTVQTSEIKSTKTTLIAEVMETSISEITSTQTEEKSITTVSEASITTSTSLTTTPLIQPPPGVICLLIFTCNI